MKRIYTFKEMSEIRKNDTHVSDLVPLDEEFVDILKTTDTEIDRQTLKRFITYMELYLPPRFLQKEVMPRLNNWDKKRTILFLSSIMLHGFSVTELIKYTQQPFGGYINWKDMNKESFTDEKIIAKDKLSIHISLLGTIIDYLLRYIETRDKISSFDVALRGALTIDDKHLVAGSRKGEYSLRAERLLDSICGLDDESIKAACKLCSFDVAYRTKTFLREWSDITVTKETIYIIKVLLERSQKFLDKYAPVVKYGFTFGEKGYTNIVRSGDGDFLTKEILWDLKVSTREPNKNQTMQILLYYIMGKHSQCHLVNQFQIKIQWFSFRESHCFFSSKT